MGLGTVMAPTSYSYDEPQGSSGEPSLGPVRI